MDLYIPVILGTAREGRASKNAANFILEQTKQLDGVETELIDVADYLFCKTENPQKEDVRKKWSAIAKKADAFIIVSPEYNHGYPGELKMMLDALYPQFAKKAIGFCGVSKSDFGGARVIEALKLISVEFHMCPVREAVYFKNARELFEEDGTIKDERYSEHFAKFADELLWFAKALKQARSNS